MPSGEALQEQMELLKKSEKNLMPEQEFNKMVADMERQISLKNSDNTLHFGFIAQELREIFPNLVGEDSYGFLSVNYAGLIPVIVDALKEQNKIIEAQQMQINSLLENRKTIGVDMFMNGAILYQNNPNPFFARTEIKYYIPANSNNATIRIYDMLGSQILKFDITDSGNSSLTIQGSQLKAGMYLYSLIVDGNEVDTKRMILTD
jgi:hypothetical protein